jgi:hypothetical protein
MGSGDKTRLGEMKSRIDQIESLALELKKLGEGAPVVEKNARTILSATYILKFGVSDCAELAD